MRLYTGGGDRGSTWCGAAGGRVPKTHPCVEFIGALDEAESAVALARALAEEKGLEELASGLGLAEEALWRIGFWLAGKRECITQDLVRKIESLIDRIAESLAPGFTMNGATAAAAAAALARATVRRAERRLWACLDTLPERPDGWELAARLLNRLSDLLYALQRRADLEQGQEPPPPPCTEPG